MTMHSTFRRMLAGGILSSLIVSFSWCQGPPGGQNSSDREYDIEVTRTTSNDCDKDVVRLSADNFIVSQGKQTFAVSVSQPVRGKSSGLREGARHLLIVLPPGSVWPTQKDLLKGLEKAIAAGWSIKVSKLDGSFTPYETSFDAMRQDLSIGAGQTLSQRAPVAAIEAAANELSWFAGRRALLVFPPQKRDPVLSSWFVKQVNAFSRLYLIDGGVGVEYTGTDLGWKGVTADLTIEQEKRVYEHGVYHEVRFFDAIKNLISDSHCDFDVQFRVPISNQQTADSINLTLRSAKALESFRVEMYALNHSGSPQISFDKRVGVPQKLTIKEK